MRRRPASQTPPAGPPEANSRLFYSTPPEPFEITYRILLIVIITNYLIIITIQGCIDTCQASIHIVVVDPLHVENNGSNENNVENNKNAKKR